MSEPHDDSTVPPTSDPSKRGLRERAAGARERAERLKRQAVDRVEHERGRRASVASAVEIYERDKRSAGGLLAGGLAFRLFLWMLPFALLMVTVVSLVSDVGDRDPSDLAESAGLSAAFAGTVAKAVRDSDKARIVLLVLGLYLTYAAGKSVVKALAVVHIVAWQLGVRPRAWRRRGSLAFTGIAIGLWALLTVMRQLFGGGLATDFLITLFLVGTLAAIAVFASRLLPHAEGTTWTAFLPGALLFALGIEALRLFSTLFLAPRLAVTPELYGALGLASVFLLWLYLLARCVVACAFTNATLWMRAHPTTDVAASVVSPMPAEAPALRVEPDPQAVDRPQP